MQSRIVSSVVTGVALGLTLLFVVALARELIATAAFGWISGLAVLAAVVAAAATYLEEPAVTAEVVSLPSRSSPWIAIVAGAVAVGVSVVGLSVGWGAVPLTSAQIYGVAGVLGAVSLFLGWRLHRQRGAHLAVVRLRILDLEQRGPRVVSLGLAGARRIEAQKLELVASGDWVEASRLSGILVVAMSPFIEDEDG